MKQIKVVQIIDSLDPGGAEMMAVNLANELAKKEEFISYLIASRNGGLLEERIHSNVKKLILHKTGSKDVKALRRLYRFLKSEEIDIVHSHSTSFYFPVLLKPFCNFKLVWHDHLGTKIDMENGKRNYPIKGFTKFFDFSFAVNRQLLETNTRFFKIPESKISYLPNFSNADKPETWIDEPYKLKGEKKDRLVCLANLRLQKDHLNLLSAFRLVLSERPDTYLYLVGIGGNDDYQMQVLHSIEANGLQENVTWLGKQIYPAEILGKCGMGVLSSESEGFPLALIEYGLSGLAVAATSVGEIPGMVTDGIHALLVPSKNAEALAKAMLTLLNNHGAAIQMGEELQQLVKMKYSADAVMQQVVYTYKNLGIKDA